MSKREQLLKSVRTRQRQVRPQEEIKKIFKPGKTRNWIPQLFSFRQDDLERLKELRDKALQKGIPPNKSYIVRAALLALQECSEEKQAEFFRKLAEGDTGNISLSSGRRDAP